MLHFDLAELIKTFGYLGLFLVIFSESGLFFGFFFPGDSVLFMAGFLASQNLLNIWVLAPLMMIAAIGGDSAGFWMGGKFGSWLIKKKDSFFFKKKYLMEAQEFYEKHGGKTLILARFIPAVRTFVPIAAGMAKMKYANFIKFNIFGGILWGAGMTILGYFLGSLIPDADRYLLPVIGIIIAVSVLPGAIHLIKGKHKHSSLKLE